MAQNQHLLRGATAEDKALTLLEQHGLKLIARNFRTKRGELDLVMLDQQQLVIVEVRYRRHAGFGSAAETVNQAKQHRIITATQIFLSQHPAHANRVIRFDVVALQSDQEPQWLKDAFQTD